MEGGLDSTSVSIDLQPALFPDSARVLELSKERKRHVKSTSKVDGEVPGGQSSCANGEGSVTDRSDMPQQTLIEQMALRVQQSMAETLTTNPATPMTTGRRRNAETQGVLVF
ncbi:hypothetical protein AAHC03_017144 [Spirometra sp. Aus1]